MLDTEIQMESVVEDLFWEKTVSEHWSGSPDVGTILSVANKELPMSFLFPILNAYGI